LSARISVITVVRKPPDWNETRGLKDSPIMMQKMVSEPKPQARSTIS
jgi:hypothetical protein